MPPCQGGAPGVPCVVLYNNASSSSQDALYGVLSFELYAGDNDKAVPVLELAARGYLVISLAVLFRLIRRKKTPKVLLNDAWGAESSSNRAQRRYSFVVLWDLAIALIVLSLMLLPIVHTGAFGALVFAFHGMVDNLPWALGLHPPSPTATSTPGTYRAIILPMIISVLRLLLVVLQDQRPLLEVRTAPSRRPHSHPPSCHAPSDRRHCHDGRIFCRVPPEAPTDPVALAAAPGLSPAEAVTPHPVQSFFAFAPTEYACWCTFALGICYALLFLSTYLPRCKPCGVWLGPAIRPQCRGWLAFLTVT